MAAIAAFASYAGAAVLGVHEDDADASAVCAGGWGVIVQAARVFPLLGPPGEPTGVGPVRFLHDLHRDLPEVYAALATVLEAWQERTAAISADYVTADAHDLGDYWHAQYESAVMVVAMLPAPAS
jgi:hypothetical protein